MSKNVYQSTSTHFLLVITGAYNLQGGIAAANRLVIQSLLSDHSVDIYALNEPIGSSLKYQHLPKVSYHSFNLNKIKFAFAVWVVILRRRYKIVFCDHANLSSILAPLRLMGLIHYTLRLNGIEVFSSHLDAQGKFGIMNASRLLAISSYTQEQINLSFPELDVQVVDLSLDLEHSQDLALVEAHRPPLDLTASDGSLQSLRHLIILHVGRMATSEQYKGQDVLIQAMPQILELHPQAQLVFAGQGDDMERLLVLARSNSPEVQAAIFFAGFVSEELLTQLYQQCYVFAMPSRGEGFGLVYIEAMRWAKPCIASRVDAAQYIVQHEITGLLVEDATSSESVAHTVINLLDDPERARQYGLAGYQRVLEHYTFEHFRERFLTSLNS